MSRTSESRQFQQMCTAGDETSEQTRNIGISINERRILLIGKTGVGKSTTGNIILGRVVFQTAPFGKSVTTKTMLGEAQRFDKKLLVVDTPGLSDTTKNNEEVMTEIAKCYGITSPGLHAIVLVVRIGRITEEDNKTFEFFLERFGQNVIHHLVIAFTGKSELDEYDMTIYDFFKTLEEESSLKTLLNRINRFVVFGRNKDIDEEDKQVRNLLSMIDSMVEANGGNFYTNEMYEETEKIIARRWEEEKRKEKEKRDKEIEEAIKNRTREEKQKEQQYLESLDWKLLSEEYRRKIRMETNFEMTSMFAKTICEILLQIKKL